MVLQNIDKSQSSWRAVENYCRIEIERLRSIIESPHTSEAEYIQHRAALNALKDLLASASDDAPLPMQSASY
jgi:hypothetical protein